MNNLLNSNKLIAGDIALHKELQNTIIQYNSDKSEADNKNVQAEFNKNNITLACQDNMVYSCVDLFPKSINSIIEETGLDIKVITNVLLNLELRNYIREISKNYYVRVINSAQFS